MGRGSDDAFAWSIVDKTVLMVVADGAGSRQHSALGSTTAVVAARDHFLVGSMRPSEMVPTLFDAALSGLADLADETAISLSDLATTMAIAVIGGDEVAVGQVGDSIAVVRLADEGIVRASIPEGSEYANETVFITSSEALSDHLRLDVYPGGDVDAIALSTDGLRMKLTSTVPPHAGRPFEPFFEDVFAYSSQPESSSSEIVRFLESVKDQTGDDKTLLLGVRGGPEDLERVIPRAIIAALTAEANEAPAIGASE